MRAEDSVEKIHACSTNQARNQGGAKPPLENFSSPLEKCVGHSLKTIGHSSKNVGPSQKTLRSSLCSKLVTGLVPIHPQKAIFHPAIPNNDTLVDASVTAYHSIHIDSVAV